MKILLIGGGGREHALAWKIAQDKRRPAIFCAPGNAGTASLGTNIAIQAEDIEGLLAWAKRERPDLTVVGPEAPLCAGIVDRFEAEGLRVFGPNRAAAQLEGSKIFTKDVLRAAGVPTAQAAAFADTNQALAHVRTAPLPLVIKADGLAAGKGVLICQTRAEAKDAINQVLVSKTFGAAGSQILVEEFLEGEEVSVLALVDGKRAALLPSAQDHKRIFDGDKGPNTGGMGAYSPAPMETDAFRKLILATVFDPTLQELRRRGIRYQGVLYAGMMMTKAGPKVLEFNCRFGDPETQAILPRLTGDLIPAMEACIDGTIKPEMAASRPESCVCVVMAAGGYPGAYRKGDVIAGLAGAAAIPQAVVFHAGTRLEKNRVVTAGGRVLGVTALGADLAAAASRAYRAAAGIEFAGVKYRRDIAARGLACGGCTMMKTKPKVRPEVGLAMGSDSDWPLLEPVVNTLRDFGVAWEAEVMSAHRTPRRAAQYADQAAARGLKVIIAAAGGAAHLAGVLAAHTSLPVIGIPIKTGSLDGMDSLLSTVQMPAGIPVATVALGSAGPINAAILAVQILALGRRDLAAKLTVHKQTLKKKVKLGNRKIQAQLENIT